MPLCNFVYGFGILCTNSKLSKIYPETVHKYKTLLDAVKRLKVGSRSSQIYHNFLDFFLNCRMSLGNKAIYKSHLNIKLEGLDKSFSLVFPNSAAHTIFS